MEHFYKNIHDASKNARANFEDRIDTFKLGFTVVSQVLIDSNGASASILQSH